jgi:ADP-L-glycero-D-manno-heptose 6-epimerase
VLAVNAPRPILVTGAAGFIGARMVERLAAQGIPVISVDRLEHFATRIEHKGLNFGLKVDRDQLYDWLSTESPKIAAVIHLGACSKTTELDVDFLRRVNLEYSQHLWTYCTQNSIPFMYASSAATYGEGELGYSDDEALIAQLKPLNPYGESKRLFDLWVVEQEKRGQTPPTWSGYKFFNVYGWGERHKESMASVVLHAFDQIKRTGRVRLFESHRAEIPHGHQKRDFIFVDDVINVLEFARTKSVPRGIFNLGTGEARTFLDLAHAVFASLGQAPQIDFIPTPLALRERYQYFTEARMEHLRAAGYSRAFSSLESGVAAYLGRLKTSST